MGSPHHGYANPGVTPEAQAVDAGSRTPALWFISHKVGTDKSLDG